jgi:hypothetical protein
MATPAVVRWFTAHAALHRIEVYVSHKLQQIAVSVDQDGLEATSKQRSVSSVGSVETLGEHTIDVTHGPGKISEGSVDQQMIRKIEPYRRHSNTYCPMSRLDPSRAGSHVQT